MTSCHVGFTHLAEKKQVQSRKTSPESPFLAQVYELPHVFQVLERKNLMSKVCFSGSVLLETFDIQVLSYDGLLD